MFARTDRWLPWSDAFAANLTVDSSVFATENRAADVPATAATAEKRAAVKRSRICKFQDCTRYVVNRGLCIGHGVSWAAVALLQSVCFVVVALFGSNSRPGAMQIRIPVHVIGRQTMCGCGVYE